MNKENKTKQHSSGFNTVKSTEAQRDNVLTMRSQVEQKKEIAERDLYRRIVSRSKHL